MTDTIGAWLSVGFRLAPDELKQSGHVRVQVFTGIGHGSQGRPTRGNCGEIVMRREEWDLLEQALIERGVEDLGIWFDLAAP